MEEVGLIFRNNLGVKHFREQFKEGKTFFGEMYTSNFISAILSFLGEFDNFKCQFGEKYMGGVTLRE